MDALFPAGRTGAQTGRAPGPAGLASAWYWLKFIVIIISLIGRVGSIQTPQDGVSFELPGFRDQQLPYTSDLSAEVGRLEESFGECEREEKLCEWFEGSERDVQLLHAHADRSQLGSNRSGCRLGSSPASD